MIVRKGAVQPWLTESVGFTLPVTVVTGFESVVIRPVQGVALATGSILVLEILVPVVVPVQPP